MKKIFRTVAIALLCGAMAMPTLDAQTRGRNNGASSTSRPQQSMTGGTRPSPSNRPTTGGTSGRPVSGGTASRPGGNQQPRPQQPNNRPGGNQQPGPQQPNSRPGGNQQPNNRPPQPGAPGGPIGAQHPNYRPSGPGYGHPGPGPQRPGMPPFQPWARPTPPPSWRPPVAWRPFHSILGIALGATINASVNLLINSGYAVQQYGNGVVYVDNVPMLNLLWPNAILYYGSGGGLCGSRFMYSTNFYDMTRYNSVYALLVNQYGAPFSVQNTGSGLEAHWWGTGNQFITLAYAPQYNSYGGISYYTTLSFGN